MSPREIARMLTSDPDIINESVGGKWQHTKRLTADELEDPQLLGELMYTVQFTVGINASPGEEKVMYYPNGDGYPGSPPSIEWDILSIDAIEAYDASGKPVKQELSSELGNKIKEALYKKISDEDLMSELDNGPEDDSDYEYERRRDDR